MDFDHMGFTGTKEYSEEDKCWFGVIENIVDTISYESETEEGLFDAFIDAVNDYIDLCNRTGKEVSWK